MNSLEAISRVKKPAAALIAAGMAVYALVSLPSEGKSDPRASTVQTWDTDPSDDVVFDGGILYEGGTWYLNCFAENGTLRKNVAKFGDTLLSLAQESGSVLIQPASLGSPDIPLAVYAEALARINDLKDPNVIQAGAAYQFPASCRLG